MSYLLALDQGTTSSRAMVFDADGRVCGQAQRGFGQHFPHPGWVEHDPAEILASQLGCAREALAAAGLAAGQLAALGIANQRETTVLWERASGRALAPAIVWQDRRTAAECERLRAEGWAEALRARTGRQARTQGQGKRQPVAPNARPDGSDDPEGRQRNRRVQILIEPLGHASSRAGLDG